MQDRFKFRVWDETLKKYADKENIVIECKTGNVHGNQSYGNGSVEGWILEQCTGFNDKHGVLIYDGDIIQNDIGNRTVYFNGYCGCWGFKTNKFNSTFIDYSSVDFEIIGNIHENPELLAGVE